MVICSICLEELVGTYTEVPGCRHRFHPGCLSIWCLQRPMCPLCTANISQVEVHDSGQTTVKAVAEAPRPVEVNLDCLDHTFFAEELGKLKRIASGVKLSRFRKRGAQADPIEVATFQSIQSRIDTLTSENRHMLRFDPTNLISELQTLHTALLSLRNGQLPSAESPLLRDTVYGAEDFAELPDDSSDEEDFVDEY